MRRPRLRPALLAAAVLAAGVPTAVLADAPALHCGVKQSGFWETIPIDSFKPVQTMTSPDSVSAWTVDESRPQDLAVTNGVRIQITTDHGCDWSDSLALSFAPGGGQTFAGANAKIMSVALLGSTHVAAVQEGTGAASRPHIMVGSGDSWTTADSGLPAQGAPKLLRTASDGKTLYLTISPTGSGGSDGGTTGLPGGLPVGGGGGVESQTGLLYASTDRGHTWELRTTANDLPSGGTGFTALDVDSSSSNRLYGIVSGRLAVSSDGGGSFRTTAENDFTSLTAMGPLTVAAFRGSGKVYYSTNGGANFSSYAAPSGVTSVGFRDGDQALVIERSGALQRFTIFSQQVIDTPAGAVPRKGSVTGDRGQQASFHALAGHSLLRYVDPVGKGVVIPPIAAGDTSVPPPRPGKVVPATQSVTLPVGTAGTANFTLDLPKNPTPLDLFFLVDASGSMVDYIQNLKGNINRIVGSLSAQHVNLKVGVGTLGSGPREGEKPYPPTYVYPPERGKPQRSYNKPVIYRRIRPVGDTGPRLREAVNSITIESDDVPSQLGGGGHEGQLLALSQVALGTGIQTAADKLAGPTFYTDVPPGQDAHFRPNQSVRKIVILATDEAFDDPYPQAHTPDDRPIFTQALSDLNARGVQVIGMSAGDTDSLPDLRRVAKGTNSLAPPGGVYCGIDPSTDLPENIAAGQPLVCNSGDHFAEAIIRLLSSLVDRQSVKLVPLAKSPVLGALQGSALLGLNVKKPNAAPFTVNVSCVGVKPGRYGGDIAAVLRGTQVGRAHVTVTCVKAQAAAPPRPLPPVGNPPAPPPNPPAPPALPPVPPAPAVQAQIQVQTQLQVNPMTAGALQEQQELQLALAMSGVLKDDDPVFNPGADMAMVDRRKREQVQALYLLAFAMTTCAGLGLARLRAKPEVQLRRAS
ncbi:MAG: hypothetical protein ABR549_11955 [Mycobacteriales bacterium]